METLNLVLLLVNTLVFGMNLGFIIMEEDNKWTWVSIGFATASSILFLLS